MTTLISAALLRRHSLGLIAAASLLAGCAATPFQNRNELYTDHVFAGLALVVLIGLAVEGIGFATLERLTVRRWGQQR